MTELADKILAVDRALAGARVPHAFGGALALAFHTLEPRATRDMDINIFCPPTEATMVFNSLPDEVQWSANDKALAEREGQVRVFWGETPIDLFFSTSIFHDRAHEEVLSVPFASSHIPILGATELMVFKAFFDRTKDWADIEEMVSMGSADTRTALGWLVDLLGNEDHRVERLRSLTRGQAL